MVIKFYDQLASIGEYLWRGQFLLFKENYMNSLLNLPLDIVIYTSLETMSPEFIKNLCANFLQVSTKKKINDNVTSLKVNVVS